MATQNGDAIAVTRKVIVHVSNANPVRLKAALDETEGLLDTYRRANSQTQVEVIANKRGEICCVRMFQPIIETH